MSRNEKLRELSESFKTLLPYLNDTEIYMIALALNNVIERLESEVHNGD